MCDYSLMHFPNRLAAEGEVLVVHRFPNGCQGLASPADVDANRRKPYEKRVSVWAALKDLFTSSEQCAIPAVCVPPGARLRIEGIEDRFRRSYGLNGVEEATFDQLTAAVNEYRDAVVFGNGVTLKLHVLPAGLRVTILTLSSAESDEPALVSYQPTHN